MIDYYLKFKDQAEADKVLADINASVDVIGTIHKPTGKLLEDMDGNEYPAFAAIDGYHVNVRAGEEIPVLDNYKIEPKTPSRVWA
jgi:hypothetical protein